MNVFDTVKQSVTTRQAAEMYGLKIRRNNMASCPFHDDRTPSMKVDKRFHCFGCGADGDVINFVSRLYGISGLEAAQKTASDFGISYDSKSVKAKQKQAERKKIRCTNLCRSRAALFSGSVRLLPSFEKVGNGLCSQYGR